MARTSNEVTRFGTDRFHKQRLEMEGSWKDVRDGLAGPKVWGRAGMVWMCPNLQMPSEDNLENS